jgi:hypothetical protein
LIGSRPVTYGLGLKSVLGTLATLWVLFMFGSRLAYAQDVPEGRVRIERPLAAEPLVDEAVTRTLGELSALGLEVEVLHRAGATLARRQLPALDTGIHGLIAIYRFEGRVRVDAWAPSGGRALQLEFDPNERGVNAEVIAIRAVEALRTRWLQYERETAAALPGRVAKIARANGTPAADAPSKLGAPSAPARRQPDAPPSDSSTSARATEPTPYRLRAMLGFAFAAETIGTHHWTGDASFGVGYGAATLSLVLDSSITRFALSNAAGDVQGTRTRILLEVGTDVPLAERWVAFAALRVGMARYGLDASAAPGFIEHDTATRDLAGAAVGGIHYWARPNWGIHFGAEVNALAHALAIDAEDNELGRLGMPGLALRTGLSLRYP